MRLRLASDFPTIPLPLNEALSYAVFSRIDPVHKPYGSRSTCHCDMGLSHRAAVETMAPKVASAKQKQLAQKTVGSRSYRTFRVCSGLRSEEEHTPELQ